ncbi:MAG: hypothetical protein H2171_13120 [Opitutus sp.]|nr:hypothetical protein [Opitutus sp.]MCS6278252.1 hypothetical protein [Opitutus sp.]
MGPTPHLSLRPSPGQLVRGQTPVTTSEVVDEEMGAATLRRLINRLEAPGESRQTILLPSKLVVGATSRIERL